MGVKAKPRTRNFAKKRPRLAGTVGNRIRAIREERDKLIPGEYTQAAVARRLGVSANTVRSWELDRARPRKAAAKRLAKVLGVKVEDLQVSDEPEPGGHSTEPAVSKEA